MGSHRDPPGAHPLRRGAAGSVAAFCLRFAGLALGLFALVFALGDAGAEPLCRIIASIVTTALRALGVAAERSGTLVTVDGFRGSVADQCTGLFEIALLVAAIWAWRAPLLDRVLGTLVSVGFLFLVNLVRVASLLLIGAHAPTWFTMAHLYVWQALLVAVVGVTWLLWARRSPAID